MKTQIDLLKTYGLQIRGILGQHLLIDPNLQRKTVNLLELSEGDWVLEIGPGLGALTGWMLECGARVAAVEKDPRFLKVLEEIYAREIEEGRLILVQGDILETDFKKLRTRHGITGKTKLAGNLPYYITAPILFKVFEDRELFSRAVFTMQLEVAARIFANPGSKDYGRLSVMVRLFTDVTHAFDISPGCFTPAPKVRSSVIVCDFHHRPLKGGHAREQEISEFVKVAFSQRRKKLISVLARHDKFGLSKADWQEIFKKRGFPESVRAEELLLKDFLTLSGKLSAPAHD